MRPIDRSSLACIAGLLFACADADASVLGDALQRANAGRRYGSSCERPGEVLAECMKRKSDECTRDLLKQGASDGDATDTCRVIIDSFLEYRSTHPLDPSAPTNRVDAQAAFEANALSGNSGDVTDFMPKPSAALIAECNASRPTVRSGRDETKLAMYLYGHPEIERWGRRFLPRCTTGDILLTASMWFRSLGLQRDDDAAMNTPEARRLSNDALATAEGRFRAQATRLRQQAEADFKREHADKPQIFGIPLGAPLGMPRCSTASDLTKDSNTCHLIGKPSGRAQSAIVHLGSGELPVWLERMNISVPSSVNAFGYAVHLIVELYDGRVGGIRFRPSTMTHASTALTDRFGTAVTTEVPMHNAAGAQWVGKRYAWTQGDVVASMDCTGFRSCDDDVVVSYRPFLAWKKSNQQDAVERDTQSGRRL